MNFNGKTQHCFRLSTSSGTNIITANAGTWGMVIFKRDGTHQWCKPSSITGDTEKITYVVGANTFTNVYYDFIYWYGQLNNASITFADVIVEGLATILYKNFDINGLYLGLGTQVNSELRENISTDCRLSVNFPTVGVGIPMVYAREFLGIKNITLDCLVESFETISICNKLKPMTDYTQLESANLNIVKYSDDSIWISLYEVIDSLTQEYETINLVGEMKEIPIISTISIPLIDGSVTKNGSGFNTYVDILCGFPILNGVIRLNMTVDYDDSLNMRIVCQISYKTPADYLSDMQKLGIPVGSLVGYSINPTILQNVNEALEEFNETIQETIDDFSDAVEKITEKMQSEFNSFRQTYVSR